MRNLFISLFRDGSGLYIFSVGVGLNLQKKPKTQKTLTFCAAERANPLECLEG